MDDQFEIVVVDDASTDGSVAAVEPFLSDPRVKLVVSGINKGEWGARAAGIATARGEWIIGLDSDDEFLQGGLSMIQAAVEDHGAEFERLGFEYVYDIGGKSPLPEISLPIVLDLSSDTCVEYSEIERSRCPLGYETGNIHRCTASQQGEMVTYSSGSPSTRRTGLYCYQ